jgi:hypothetical protein
MTAGNIASVTVFLLQSQFALVTMKPFLGLLNRNGGSILRLYLNLIILAHTCMVIGLLILFVYDFVQML